MTPISTHIGSNIVGYTALFVALTGSAVALPGKAREGRAAPARGSRPRLAYRCPDRRGHPRDRGRRRAERPRVDLAGTYPNPQLAVDSVAAAEVAENTLTGADIDEATLAEEELRVSQSAVDAPCGSSEGSVCEVRLLDAGPDGASLQDGEFVMAVVR